MRSKLLVAVALVLCATARDVRAQQQFQLYRQRRGRDLGNPWPRCEPTDLRVMEGGVEAKVDQGRTGELAGQGPAAPRQWHRPGGGQPPDPEGWCERTASRRFRTNLEVTIVTTAPQPRFLVRPTTDKAMMIEGLVTARA